MAYKTTRALDLIAWPGIGGGYPITLPEGSRALLVKGLSGLNGDGFAVASIRQLVELTGNHHDPKYRYVDLPADAIAGETEAEKAEVARIAAKQASRKT